MARSSTVVGHVGYHCSMPVMKSRAGSDYRRDCERSRRLIRKRRKEERIRNIHTLSMVKPRFFALTVWEPSIGRADTHVHDKVKFYTTIYLFLIKKRMDE